MGEYIRNQGVTFYNVSSGKLKRFTGKKDEKGDNIYQLLDGYEGILTAVEKFEDEFEGKKQYKIRIKMKDPKSEDVADITMTDSTFFVAGLFSRLPNIDLADPFLLGVLPSDQNSKVSFCFLKQYNKKIEKSADFPQPDKVDLGGGKIAYNWSKVEKVVDGMIAEINGLLNTKNVEEEPVNGDAPPF